jgi:hypothetical protein
MSYLKKCPTYTRQTGSTLEVWPILLRLSEEFALSLPSGLAGLAQLGCLDAVHVMPAGGMTTTGLGYPIPLFTLRAA